MIWHTQMIFILAHHLSFYGMIQHTQMICYIGTKLEFLWCKMVHPIDIHNGTVVLHTHLGCPVDNRVYLECPSDSFAYVMCQEHGVHLHIFYAEVNLLNTI